jgi:diketogulonate reductase-like aldo/keto reductase
LLIAGREVEGIGLGTAQFAFRDGTAQDCAERGIGYLAHAPFGGPSGSLPAATVAVARRRDVSAHRVLLAWLRAQSPAIVPLAGASKPGSIRDSATPFGLMDLDLEDLRG